MKFKNPQRRVKKQKRVGKKPHRVDAHYLIHHHARRCSEPQIQCKYLNATGLTGSLFPLVYSSALSSMEIWNSMWKCAEMEA